MMLVSTAMSRFIELYIYRSNTIHMKPIIIPTDFSEAALAASEYALFVAKYLKTNLEMCHSFVVPLDSAVMVQLVWPTYDYDSLKEDVELQLEGLAKSLMDKGKSLNRPNTFKPVLNYTAESDSIVGLINNLVKEKRAGLVVVGMSGNGPVRKFFTGSTSRDLIENACFPLLLIPHGCQFKSVQKIAFATDFSLGDIEALNGLVVFARCFDAEIVIVHVDRTPAESNRKEVADFLNEVTCKINYDKIYYREINSKNVNNGLQWLSEHGWIDLLVMVHRRDSLVDRLLKKSITKRQAARISIPLMVLPEGLVPVF